MFQCGNLFQSATKVETKIGAQTDFWILREKNCSRAAICSLCLLFFVDFQLDRFSKKGCVCSKSAFALLLLLKAHKRRIIFLKFRYYLFPRSFINFHFA